MRGFVSFARNNFVSFVRNDFDILGKLKALKKKAERKARRRRILSHGVAGVA